MTTKEKMLSIDNHRDVIKMELHKTFYKACGFGLFSNVFDIMFDCNTGLVWTDEHVSSNSWTEYHDSDIVSIVRAGCTNLYDVMTSDEMICAMTDEEKESLYTYMNNEYEDEWSKDKIMMHDIIDWNNRYNGLSLETIEDLIESLYNYDDEDMVIDNCLERLADEILCW